MRKTPHRSQMEKFTRECAWISADDVYVKSLRVEAADYTIGVVP
jgi:hypothetical protein